MASIPDLPEQTLTKLQTIYNDLPQNARAAETTPPFISPSYTLMNANLSLSKDDWSLSLYVQNLANKQALVSNQAQGAMGRRMIYATPRTIGMGFSYWYN